MSYNSGVLVLLISNQSSDYSLNCTPLSPITITNNCVNNKKIEYDCHLTSVIYALYVAVSGPNCPIKICEQVDTHRLKANMDEMNRCHRLIRLTQSCTQFKSLWVKVLWVLHLPDNAAIALKWHRNTWNETTFYSEMIWIWHSIKLGESVYDFNACFP